MPSNVNTVCSDSGGASEEIKIGAGILDYITELGKIQEKIKEAYAYAEECVQNMENGETYQGAASEEMNPFFESLAANLQKMIFLYQAAEAYIYNAYNTMYYNEQQLVNWVIGEVGKE